MVTLNLSMVEMMKAGVVRKNKSRKRAQLIMKQRTHQVAPTTDRCSLWEEIKMEGYIVVKLRE